MSNKLALEIVNFITVAVVTYAACSHLGGIDGLAATLAFFSVVRAIGHRG